MPAVPKRGTGRRGPIATSDAPNRLDRLDAHRGTIRRFTRRAATPVSNNRAERDIGMAKVKQKVSGGFRTVAFAEADCRLSELPPDHDGARIQPARRHHHRTAGKGR